VGEPEGVVDAYLDHVTSMTVEDEGTGEHAGLRGENGFSIVDVRLLNEQEQPQARFDRGEKVLVDIVYSATQALPGVTVGVSIRDAHGYGLGGVVTEPDSVKVSGPIDQATLRLTLAPLLFNRGAYTLSVQVTDRASRRSYALRRRAARLVVDGHRAATRDSSGYVYYPHQWEQLR
jgi:hypothetical protein